MTRIDQLRVPGYEVNLNGYVYISSDGTLSYDKVRSDIVKTESHKAWLSDHTLWVAPTPYQAEVSQTKAGYGILRNGASGQEWAGNIRDFGYPDHYNGAPDTSTVISDAIFKLRAKIKDQDVNFGAAIAEGRQSIQMIADAASAVAKSFTALKHGDFGSAARALQLEYSRELKRRMKNPRKRYRGETIGAQTHDLANRWLELQFGWKPLLGDIDGAARKLANDATANPTRHRFKVSTRAWKPYRPRINTEQLEWTTPDDPVVDNHAQMNKGRIGVQMIAYWGFKNRVAAEAARSGLIDPLSVIWEVVPFSFIVDWVYPVGKVLDSISATAGKEFISGTMTTFTKLSAKRVGELLRYPEGQSWIDTTNTHLKYTKMDRVVLTDFPALELPHLKNPLSVTHALDALALLAGATQGIGRRY